MEDGFSTNLELYHYLSPLHQGEETFVFSNDEIDEVRHCDYFLLEDKNHYDLYLYI